MTLNWKKLYKPVIYAGTGLFTLIFMFFNYCSAFAIYGKRDMTRSVSGYGTMKFGRHSAWGKLEKMFDNFGEEPNFGLLLILQSIIMIVILILAIVLLAYGVIGILKNTADIRILPTEINKTTEKYTGLVLMVNWILHATSAFFVLLSCVINLYTAEMDEDFLMGLMPGAGLFLLLILTIGAWLAFVLLSKNFGDDDSDTVYTCAACGAKARAGEKFCQQCGGAVVAKVVEAKPDVKTLYTCTKCGAKAKAGAKFCQQCGGEVVSQMISGYACSQCGAKAKATVKFCQQCGGAVVAQIVTPVVPTVTCAACGAQVPTSDKFCQQCGTKVAEENE